MYEQQPLKSGCRMYLVSFSGNPLETPEECVVLNHALDDTVSIKTRGSQRVVGRRSLVHNLRRARLIVRDLRHIRALEMEDIGENEAMRHNRDKFQVERETKPAPPPYVPLSKRHFTCDQNDKCSTSCSHSRPHKIDTKINDCRKNIWCSIRAMGCRCVEVKETPTQPKRK